MRLNAPSKLFFIISLILFIAGFIAPQFFSAVPFIGYAPALSWIVLALGCILKGA